MAKPRKLQNTTIFHQNCINTSEVELYNRMNQSRTTEKARLKNLCTALVPMLVRDVNTEIGIISVELDKSLSMMQQGEQIKEQLQSITEKLVEEHFQLLSSLIVNKSVKINISAKNPRYNRSRNEDAVFIELIIELDFNIEYQEPYKIVLEWSHTPDSYNILL